MKVHELLDSPEKWTQGAYARDEDGNPVHERSQSAVRFCLIGAVNVCYRGNSYARDQVCDRLDVVAPRNGSIFWNDAPSRTFEQVRALVLELDV